MIGSKHGRDPGARFAANIERHAVTLTNLLQPEMLFDSVPRMYAGVARRESFEKTGQLGAEFRRRDVDAVRSQLSRQLLGRDRVHAPELFRAPRAHRARVHGRSVSIG